MALMDDIKDVFAEELEGELLSSGLHLKLVDTDKDTQEQILYRRNGKCIDRVVEIDKKTGSKIKTTHFDYFNDKKVRSIDEYDRETGKKLRTINYVLYKSVDEYDLETGKKIRTINYNVKDESKISSVQEYDLETGKIITIYIYKRDGVNVSIIKKIDPVTDKVTNLYNKENGECAPIDPAKYYTRSYDNITYKQPEDISNLIDNLYCNQTKFENIQ